MTLITEAFAAPSPAETASEVEALMARLLEAMDALIAMIEQETALVREGHLREAVQIERSKSEFARSYVSDLTRLSASGPALAKAAPEILESFRQRHARFHELLRTNMTVLATAHAVSEDLIRGVSGELARKTAPQTYGASGRPAVSSPSTIHPLAVSRTL
ncbi:MAG: hypothetical protein WD073_09595 [Xanthobacteraceae bacterium]